MRAKGVELRLKKEAFGMIAIALLGQNPIMLCVFEGF
jgi:hypothetical protein